MRLLVTGDRNWRNAARLHAVLALDMRPRATDILINGQAMGADIIADVVWQLIFGHSSTIERYPALWKEHGRRAGPIRNQQMLDSGVDFVVGFHDDIESSKGTRDMLRRCARAGIPGRLFTQTGEVTDWRERVGN